MLYYIEGMAQCQVTLKKCLLYSAVEIGHFESLCRQIFISQSHLEIHMHIEYTKCC